MAALSCGSARGMGCCRAIDSMTEGAGVYNSTSLRLIFAPLLLLSQSSCVYGPVALMVVLLTYSNWGLEWVQCLSAWATVWCSRWSCTMHLHPLRTSILVYTCVIYVTPSFLPPLPLCLSLPLPISSVSQIALRRHGNTVPVLT